MSNRSSIPAEVRRQVLFKSGHRCTVCGNSSPLEIAHIIPYCNSKDNTLENLICLCANCHERADKEQWGERILREYKRCPWVERKYTNNPDARPKMTQVEIRIDLELKDWDQRLESHLQHALAGFLRIPPEHVMLKSVSKGSVRIVVMLPEVEAEQLIRAYKMKYPTLSEHLKPFNLLGIHRYKQNRERLRKNKMKSESNSYQGWGHSLSAGQIDQLIRQGCTCKDWSKVQVAEGFKAETVKSAHFSGEIKLGVFEKQVSFFGGVTRPAGISEATIHNCTIGNNVYISRVRNYIANYHIEDDVVIDNVELLATEGNSSFGNGVEVAVVNEAGGREIPIYDNLSAHVAYVMAFYRHKPKVIEKLRKMISDYTASVACSMGFVGRGARLMNCRMIRNVKVGQASLIEGVSKLDNGSVNSCADDPVYIGPGVFAEDFIICSGSKITDGTIIYKCFIGQGTVLSRQYSAENSVFFANCGGFHGEACAIFAGPYTVTHHKSTLLIAGLFSFLNAGSGTNQSNHMYKLGPVHQGIVERGSKTASDSYILWPAKVGAFTVVMGRHYRNSDTSDLPFSYLIEHEDESILVPGVNLRSVGTVRDARKWPKRDRRKDPLKLDHINFKLLSPYTIQKMINGRDLLCKLKETSGETSEYFTYHSVKIKNSSLDRGVKLYQMGIDKFLGNCLIKRLEAKQFEGPEDLLAVLKPKGDIGPGRWVDMAGLLAPDEAVERMLSDIQDGSISSLEQVADSFRAMHEYYPEYEWAWTADVLQTNLGKTIEKMTADDIIELTSKWKKAVVELDNMLYADVKKEFAATAQTGYGLEGSLETKHADFAQVRGTFEENSFVMEIEKHIAGKTALGDELIRRMEQLRRSRPNIKV